MTGLCVVLSNDRLLLFSKSGWLLVTIIFRVFTVIKDGKTDGKKVNRIKRIIPQHMTQEPYVALLNFHTPFHFKAPFFNPDYYYE